MSSVNPNQIPSNDPFFTTLEKSRIALQSEDPTILTKIYQQEVGITIWRRNQSTALQESVKEFLKINPNFQKAMTVTPQTALESLNHFLGTVGQTRLSENIAELVDMFCCLFELKRADLRLVVLDSAMCPKFHVDRVPCRLVTTYHGIATEWLPHEVDDRTKLGRGSNGLADHQSGLYQNQSDIQSLNTGDVALLKGEIWQGNENAGLVHRSPSVKNDESRLLLTLDFMG